MLNNGTPGANPKFSDYYEYIRTLGRGAFGVVVEAIDQQSGEAVAVKILQKKSVEKDRIKGFRREARILAGLNHPNIVQFKALRETENKILVVMEVVRGVTLTEYMRTHPISPVTAKRIITRILEAINYCHNRGIIHRDLKPDNILVETTTHTVKVTDFGLSIKQRNQYRQPIDNQRCGTLMFMAPEQRLGTYYGNSVDMWSCGVILFMLLTGGVHPSVSDKGGPYMVDGVFVRFPSTVPDQAQDLIRKMSQKVALYRLTASEALRHPWITNTRGHMRPCVFEELTQYSDDIQLKTILFSLLFSCVTVPARPKPTRPRPINPNCSVHVESQALNSSHGSLVRLTKSRITATHQVLPRRKRGFTFLGTMRSTAKLPQPQLPQRKPGVSKNRLTQLIRSYRNIFGKK